MNQPKAHIELNLMHGVGHTNSTQIPKHIEVEVSYCNFHFRQAYVYYSHYPCCMNGRDYRQLLSIIVNHIHNAVYCDFSLSVKVNEHYEISNCVKTRYWFTVETLWKEIGWILLPESM